MDGAVHVCQTMGVCDAMARRFESISHKFSKDLAFGIDKLSMTRYTCEECVQGLEWVEMYMEDPIMVAEFTIYLEQNYCIGDQLGIEMVQSVFVFRSRIAKTGFSLILKLVLLQMNGNTARKASLNTSPQCTIWPWRSFSSQLKFGW